MTRRSAGAGEAEAGQRLSRPAPRPEDLARALEQLRRGRTRWIERRAFLKALTADALRDVPLHEVRKLMAPRHLEVALQHIGGYTYQQIADTCGYDRKQSVARILQQPAVARYVELIFTAQEERAKAGEFGVRAQAKTAAPKVMRRVIEKAGGIEDADGKPLGMAAKDADAIRAADLVIEVAGERTQRHAHHHVHQMLRDLSPAELDALAHRDEWPERWRGLVAQLGLGRAALPTAQEG